MVNSDTIKASLRNGSPAAASAIDVDRLVKIYRTTRAVDEVTFRIGRGSITGLLGGNGAGKTTTIAMIMGLVTPTSGSVTVLGAAMPNERQRVLQQRQHLSVTGGGAIRPPRPSLQRLNISR